MRQPRDFNAELKALEDRAKDLKERKLRQLGELVIATGADGLSVEELAGALLGAARSADKADKEECRMRGAAFFRGPARKHAGRVGDGAGGGQSNRDGAEPAAGETGAA